MLKYKKVRKSYFIYFLKIYHSIFINLKLIVCLEKCKSCEEYTGKCLSCWGDNREPPHCTCKIGFGSSDQSLKANC
jgi:hypothetical protein